MTFIVQSYFDTLLRYVLSVIMTFCGAVVLKVMDQTGTRLAQMKLEGAYNCVYRNTWRVCQTRVHKCHKSLIGDLAGHSFSLFDWTKRQPQTSKTSEHWLASH